MNREHRRRLRSLVIGLFEHAINVEKSGEDASHREDYASTHAAFAAAAFAGWDSEKDNAFSSWANKATGLEICCEGLLRFIEATRSADPVDGLVDDLAAFCVVNQLTPASADAMYADETLTDAQHAWLLAFCDAWDREVDG